MYLIGRQISSVQQHRRGDIQPRGQPQRQLDGGPATIELLPDVVDAVDGRCEVYLDGGVRRGEDVVRAIALGARAVFVGRPVLWGLAVAGSAGVSHVLELLGAQLDRALALMGRPRLSDLDRSALDLRRVLPCGVRGRI